MIKKLLLAIMFTIFPVSSGWGDTHGYLVGIDNKSSYQVKIQTTDTSGTIELKNGEKKTGNQIQDKPFYLSDIKNLSLAIPWGSWDGEARIYIYVLNGNNLIQGAELMERDGNVELWTRGSYTLPPQKYRTECRSLDTDYILEISKRGYINISSKKVNRQPGEVDRCNPDWARVSSGLYVGTCALAGMTQKKACEDWCDGSMDNVLDWECRGKEQWCLCKPGVARGSHLEHKIRDAITDAAKATGKFFKEDVYETGLRDNFYEKILKPAPGMIKQYGIIAADMMKKSIENDWKCIKKGFNCRPHHNYCDLGQTVFPNPPTIDSDEAKKADTDGLLPYIEKYAPIAWIEGNEDYYPITFSEYIMGPQTSLISRSSGKIILQPGQITMEKLYDMSLEAKKDWPKYEALDLAFNIAECTTFGANPDKNKDGNGNLTTPIYAITFEQNGKLYIQYLFFYGYNGAYNIGPIKGEVFEGQDFHEGDLEHITMELDKSSKELQRIYYSSHGKVEGFWLKAKDHRIEYEGTHPVVFIAHYSHAAYPREGTYVRIFGAANDITSKSQKWYPKIMRLYDESDKRFDPKTMGFMYYPGNYGIHGVQHLTGQGWFMNVSGDVGRPVDSKGNQREGFCNNPPYRSSNPIEQLKIPTDFIEYGLCIGEKIGESIIKGEAIPD